MKVEISEQIEGFIRRQAPEPRRRLRRALRRLASEEGDIGALEGRLAGYHRLRVGPYRIIFVYAPPYIRCIHAERRDIVYSVFSAALKQRLLRE